MKTSIFRTGIKPKSKLHKFGNSSSFLSSLTYPGGGGGGNTGVEVVERSGNNRESPSPPTQASVASLLASATGNNSTANTASSSSSSSHTNSAGCNNTAAGPENLSTSSGITGTTMQHSGTPQHFCLRWNNYQSNLTNVFDQLLQSESFVDVTLACDGHSVKAHKMVLSACSPYFQSLFFDNPCQHPIVIMRDIKWPELKAAVEFMYKGEINVSQEQIGPLLKVAESLKIRGLADVNGEHELVGEIAKPLQSSTSSSARGPGGTDLAGGGNGGSAGTGNSRGRSDWDSLPNRNELSDDGMSPSPNNIANNNNNSSLSRPSKKRRRHSTDRCNSLSSSPADSLLAGRTGLLGNADDNTHDSMPADLSPVPPPTPAATPTTPLGSLVQSPAPQSHGQGQSGNSLQQHSSSASISIALCNAAAVAAAAAEQMSQMSLPPPLPPPPSHGHHQMSHLNAGDRGGVGTGTGGGSSSSHPSVDDMEIKPGIAEMIREEERAKLLESSHAWLGASTSSIADFPSLLKLKAPTWTQNQLKEAIEAVVTQKMRFTQASARYGIPKGTLYDNILGKSKRMAVLEEAGLTKSEEDAVLEFCCDVSISPYNRRTKKSLSSVLKYVEKLRRCRDPEFMFTGLSGFRWWWAFCKKYSIVSLYYETDSYQYQLQSMWQKCWNTNQSLVHNLRFRERGPLKSWRPETMAEAIFSVLKEGLSLSQAARKYDIPYPTFVLYANRVHNMLGPSADGGADLRPKGRGRPQRILLGVWPDEHIRGVIRAVVFRDTHHHIKEEAHLTGYPRLHDGLSIHSYGNPGSCSSNGGPDPSVSPGSAAAAAVAAVAQGFRQQMCSIVAAASQHHGGALGALLPGGMGGLGGGSGSRGSPADSAHDLRISPTASPLDTPLSSPLALEPALNLATLGGSVEVGIGVSGMTYKPSRGFSSPRPENLFQDEIEELVKSPIQLTSPRMSLSEPKDVSIKMEPLTECRGE